MTKRVVILGGGTGGTLVANRLRKLYPETELSIEVVDRRRLRAICCVENPAAFKAQTRRSLGVNIASTSRWSTLRSTSAAV